MPQLVHALKTGELLQSPEWDREYENWKYRVEGVDTEGDSLTAVTVILESDLTLRIITVF
jgi:lipid II:glycine glycyltransferase (peptidoglycan interpeptide bridge formation enzyme)